MGYSNYSASARSVRSETLGYNTKSINEIFKNKNIPERMDPRKISLRESRDSEQHPCSIPIIIGLDVTGSMGHVPHHLVKNGLPTMVSSIINAGIPDPQIMIMAVGDHECDRAPLQVGQFECGDEELDSDLTSIFIESGGGGNDGESYFLPWLFAAVRTSCDHIEKRNKRGFLFTIGDEKVLRSITATAQEKILGPGQYSDISAAELLSKVQSNWDVYHIHIKETAAGRIASTVSSWKELLGENLVEVQSKEQVAEIISMIVAKNVNSSPTPSTQPTTVPEIISDTDEDIIL